MKAHKIHERNNYWMETCGTLRSSLFSRMTIISALVVSLLVLSVTSCDSRTGAPSGNVPDRKASLQIPYSMSAEHAALRAQLNDAIKSGGATASAAQLVADRLNAHFEKEEAYALPELVLLPQLAQGKVSDEMRDTIKLSDKLNEELPQMLNEHKAIAMALDELAVAATNENKTDAVAFTERLRIHAQNEEAILYPTAILIGEYLKLHFDAEARNPRKSPTVGMTQ